MSGIIEQIEQIGGRARLQEIYADGFLKHGESKLMARALLAVLDAQRTPIWGQARFKGGEWSSCSAEHAAMVMANPDDWVNYECRYLYTAPPAASVNSPVIPEGWILMPRKLTAENGAKAALSGDFAEHKVINCPECFGDDECERGDGSGRIKVEVTVSWSTIKAIWEKGADHFAAAPAPGGDVE